MQGADLSHIRSILRPNVASLGYALFFAVNATSVWGGVFPFLPLDFQTPQIVLWFFLGQSIAFFLTFLLSAHGAYFFPKSGRRFFTGLAAAFYFLGWCCLIAAIYLHDLALPLVIVGGALLGCGSALFYLLWQRLFASQAPAQGTHDLVVGTVYSALFYFGLYLIPRAVTSFLIALVFLPLFWLALVLKNRTINFSQPMFEDIPRENRRVYRRAITSMWRSALCIGALSLCAGIMRSFAITDPAIGSYVNILSMGALLIAALCLLAVWQIRNLYLDITKLYQMVFPFVITGLVLVPFLSESYLSWLAAGLYAVYGIALLLMMIQCAQISRTRGVNPVFSYGLFGGIVYAFHDLGFILGRFPDSIAVAGLDAHALTALLAVYLLALMLFLSAGTFKSKQPGTEGIELMAISPRPLELQAKRKRSTSAADMGEQSAKQPAYRDLISKQVDALKNSSGLSTREAEVVDLIARGYTVPRIAEQLYISENTVRTHTKHIYSKLGIHKKQELIDLLSKY